MSFLLPTLILSPFGSIFIALVCSKFREWVFLVSFLPFFISLYMWFHMDFQMEGFQFLYQYADVRFGVDGVSISLILLTTFLIPICLLVGWNSIQPRLYSCLFLIMEFFLLGVFSSLDILLFYVFFEAVLIPMFLIIGIWGSRERKIQAAYQFFLYTLLGSLFMLLGILYVSISYQSTDVEYLSYISFSVKEERILWLLFFLSFAVKIPMVPFHIWLPEAHVEAPTAGSVILAGVLLKLGAFGFYRISLPLFGEASSYFTPLIFVLSTLSIVYISLTALRQIDLKKVIAYSSVAHMGFVTYGLFTMKFEGLQGALVTLISHGLISSGLFLTVGMLYDRHKTRMMKYYRGMVHSMPIYSTLTFIFVLANMGLPLTSSFVGEIFILIGLFKVHILATLFASLGILLTTGYMLWYYNRIIFGSVTPFFSHFSDLTWREFLVIFPLVVLILFLGVYPEFLLNTLTGSILALLNETCI